MKNITFLLFVLVVTSTVNLLAQDDRPAYGILFGYNLNFHSADFRALPGVPSCCPLYDNGSGSGFSAGVLYQLPVMLDGRLAFRGVYSTYGGELRREESTVVAGNLAGTFEHTVEASLASIGVEALFQYRVFSSLWLNVGGRGGFVSTKMFSQKEAIIQPLSGVFPNGQPIRNEVINATIPNGQSIEAGLLTGLNYDLPLNLNSTLMVSPEILYYFPVTGVVSGLTWTVSQLRIGAALKWSPLPAKQLKLREEKRELIDTVKREVDPTLAGLVLGEEDVVRSVVENDDEILTITTVRRTDTLLLSRKTALAATVTASALHEDGKESPTLNIEVEEFSSVLMTPLLSYVFFEENSGELPSRYKRLDQNSRERFREEGANNPDRLVTYYHILNIIGKRMRQNTDATITLIGCNADVGVEKGNLILSQKRAESVKQYLVDVWGVQDYRLKVETRNLPLYAANTQNKDGAQENRRVEINSSNLAITAPLITNDTLKTVTPPALRFRTQVLHDNAIYEWRLQAEQDGTLLKRFDGTGNIPAVLDWNVGIEKGTQPTTNTDIIYKLNAADNRGEQIESKGSIPVKQITIKKKRIERIADKEIQRFSLILFDVRSAEISKLGFNFVVQHVV